MHDLLRWEYHAKLWALAHPYVYVIAFLLALAVFWRVNR